MKTTDIKEIKGKQWNIVDLRIERRRGDYLSIPVCLIFSIISFHTDSPLFYFFASLIAFHMRFFVWVCCRVPFSVWFPWTDMWFSKLSVEFWNWYVDVQNWMYDVEIEMMVFKPICMIFELGDVDFFELRNRVLQTEFGCFELKIFDSVLVLEFHLLVFIWCQKF